MAPRHHPGWEPARLRHLRKQAGHTQESLAEAIANVQVPDFRPPHPSPDVISDHENGRHYPTVIYRTAYRHVLGCTDEQLGFRADAPPPTGGVPSASAQRDTTTHPDGQQGGVATDRRGLIAWAATALGAPVAGMPDRPALTSDDRLALLDRAASATGAVTAAEGILHTVVGDYLALPPAVVLDRVGALQQLTDTVWAEHPLRPADTARLWKVAAVAAGIRGWLENNAGDTQAARSSLHEAHRRGELIDDDQLIAWARYMQATVENYAGDPVAAERYALDGLHHTAKHSPQRARLLVEVVARAHATRRDVAGAEKALTEAHDIVTALPPEQHGPEAGMIVDDITTYSPTGFASGTGHVYARLGQLDRFHDVTDDRRQAAERDRTYQRVFFRTDEALAVLRGADPDPAHAAGLAREGLALAGPFQSAHVGNRLLVVLDAAKPFDTHPAIRELTAYGAAWRADRLTHLTGDA